MCFHCIIVNRKINTAWVVINIFQLGQISNFEKKRGRLKHLMQKLSLENN